MDVTFDPAREALIARPVGRVDESTWEAFAAALSDGIRQAADEDREILIIDLSRIDYMSSRGLRALTTIKARGIAAGVTTKLAAPNEIMREILAISRYDRLFDVADSLPDTQRRAN